MSSPDEQSSVSFIFFFAAALVITNRDAILRSDPADLPQRMASLSVRNREELHQYISAADELQENTPYSFKQLEELKGLFTKQQSPEDLRQIS